MTWYCLSEAVLRRLELRTAAAKALLEDGANLEAPGTDIYIYIIYIYKLIWSYEDEEGANLVNVGPQKTSWPAMTNIEHWK